MNEIINFGDGKSVKVILLKGEAGNDIQSITKTATSGLVDTYTITLTDGTTHTFTVTNGKAITDIQVTQEGSLLDIYTIYFNDGTTLEIPFYKANVEMDTELSDSSTNPVENRVITQAVSHIGQIIHTTTLDTLDKVKAIYGANTHWISLSGYVLRGATSGVTPNNDAKDLGNDSHTITASELPSHNHDIPALSGTATGGNHHHLSNASGQIAQFGDAVGRVTAVNNGVAGSIYTGYSGALSLSVTTNASTTGSKGGGDAMSIIPNEKNVYMWERVS